MGNRLGVPRFVADDQRQEFVNVNAPRARGIEVCKWLGFVTMLAEHVPLYGWGASGWIATHVGALTLPLFVWPFALGMARCRDPFAVLDRLALWSVVAMPFVWLSRPWLPLSVLSTFALGLAADLLWRRLPARKRWLGAALVFVMAVGVEFQYAGVALVWSSLVVARSSGPVGFAWPGMVGVSWPALGPSIWLGLSVVFLAPYNGNGFAVVGATLAYVVATYGPRLPRARGSFYLSYIAQFPVLRVVRELVT